MNSMIEFYDANSPLDSTFLEDKSSIYIDNDIALCDNCENVILESFKDSKLICTRCGQKYHPHCELVQVQDQETAIDELSSQGEITYKNDTQKPISKTLNHIEAKLEDTEYGKKEFERYRQMEFIDEDVIFTSKGRRPNNNRNGEINKGD